MKRDWEGATERTKQMLAAIRAGELQEDIAERFGCTRANVRMQAWLHGLKTPTTRGRARGKHIRDVIRAGYEQDRPCAEIAAELGISVNNVSAQACKMGITNKSPDPGRHKRGYAVPPELREQYRELRKLGLTLKECGYNLGLLKRE